MVCLLYMKNRKEVKNMSEIIYYDKRVYKLEDTPFTHTVRDMEFKFSSYFYLQNFIERLDEKLEILEKRLAPYLPLPYKSTVNGLVTLNALNLYQHIEKRFYYVKLIHSERVIKCPTEITVNLIFSKE